MITHANASNIQAKIIVEVANGPVASNADLILRKKNILVIPDILANAGGVTVSYFEWVQNRNGYYWTTDEIHHKLQHIMSREFNLIYHTMEKNNIDMRTAAYAHALDRLGKAVAAQGTYSYFAEAVM